jgi:organic hydroperoxide reductase OsmC/OhrA
MTKDQLDAYLASKTDAWLQVELDQAVAYCNDGTNPDEMRVSAYAAAYAMAGEIERRKARLSENLGDSPRVED